MKNDKGAGVNRITARLVWAALAAMVIPACGGSGGGGGGGPVVAAPTGNYILPGPTGTRNIIVRGGRGTAGPGGNGGFIRSFQDGGSDNHFLRSGSVDTSFVIPNGPVNLGPNPRTISADTTLAIGTGLTAESLTLIGDDGATPATGLHVLPGVTLSVGPNFDNDATLATKEAWRISLTHAMLIEGTLKGLTKDGLTDTVDMVPIASELIVRSTGVIDVSGADSPPGGDGSAGGDFDFLSATNRIIVEGTIIATGGDGDNGAIAGGVNLWSSMGGVYMTGTINTCGGQGNNGVGGSGFWQRLQSATANGGQLMGGAGTYMRGTMLSRGGHGTAGGGVGRQVQIDFDTTGPYVFDGLVDASGGNCLGIGNGGNAGFIRIIARGGEGRYAGTYRARGGNGLGVGGNGGNGGEVQLNADTVFFQPVLPGLFIGGDIDCSGGDGATGGNAGFFISFTNANFWGAFVQPGKSPTFYVGYASFDASGGNGTTNGGMAGDILLQNVPVNDPGGTPWLGSLTNEVDLFARGGHGGTGNGGPGNTVALNMTNISPVAPSLTRTLVNSGMIITHGGNGVVNGGNGGAVALGSNGTFAETEPVTNSAVIVSSGGNSGTGLAGNGGAIRVSCDHSSTNTGALTSDGGRATAAAGTAGNGGPIIVEGQRASHSGAVSSRGGNAVNTVGGNGGRVDFSSWNGITPSSVTGTIVVQRGTGTPNGLVGRVFKDGWEQTLTAGEITY